MATVIGVRGWLQHWRDRRTAIALQSDSQAALGAWARQKLSVPNINVVVREMALDLAEGRYRIDVQQHISGRLNFWADALGRSAQHGKNACVRARGVGWHSPYGVRGSGCG